MLKLLFSCWYGGVVVACLIYGQAFLIISRNLLTVIMILVYGRPTTVRTNSKYILLTHHFKNFTLYYFEAFPLHTVYKQSYTRVTDRLTTFKPNTSEHKHINPHNMAPTGIKLLVNSVSRKGFEVVQSEVFEVVCQ